ncbi:hypothetical protein KSP39_PZI022571 [Platanthera zijinensis]|uniref:Uncharacterized protein n=1 Tax=Platanthera zijinensis TaxID=2320716 RepID=A0AAP0AWB9_9ASPA
MVRWADDLKSGLVSPDQLSELKENIAKLENTVLPPTEQDKWVSLHPSFGLFCWSDDDELKKQFKHSDGVDFIQFGELSVEENVMLSSDVANLFHIIGVPALSEFLQLIKEYYGVEMIDD